MVHKVDTKEEFDNYVKKSAAQLVLIDFFAEWCGPCVAIAPVLDTLSQKYTNVIFIKVDVDNTNLSAACTEYNIECMPTFVFIKNGKEVERLEGADEDTLLQYIEKHK